MIVADTAVHDMPNAEQIADIAEEAAGFARRMGYEPRVAMLAYSTFGHPPGERSERVQEAVKILDKRRVDFEYDGEMAADVALNPRLMQHYPFCRLSGPANVLVMPAFHSASISTKMLQELGGSTVIGPLLVGLEQAGADRLAQRQGLRHRQHGGDRGLHRGAVRGDRKWDWRGCAMKEGGVPPTLSSAMDRQVGEITSNRTPSRPAWCPQLRTGASERDLLWRARCAPTLLLEGDPRSGGRDARHPLRAAPPSPPRRASSGAGAGRSAG